jgi:Ca-activated chloride channel homolog
MDVGSGQHLVVVMDTSSSMRARDVSPSRFEAAQNIAADAIREAGDGAKVTLVKAGQRPQVIVDAATPAVATSAVQSLTPETESGDMATAVRVAAGAAQSQVGWAGRVVAVTDGAFTLDVSPQAVPVTFKLVGGTAENMALSEVTLRRLIERGDSLAGFARVVNFGSTARSPTMTIVADAVAVDRRTVQVPASGHIDATFRVPSSAQSVSVVLSDRDAMSGDDRVDVAGYARTAPSITIVSDEPEIWQRVLAVVPDVKTRTVSPREFRASDALDGGIVLLDGFAPTPLPRGSLIVVNPPDRSDLLVRTDPSPRVRRASDFDPDDPLLQRLDMAPLNVTQVRKSNVPDWATSTVDGEDTPLILHGRVNGQRVVLFTFDPRESNLPHLASFPLLMSNTVDWLTAGRGEILTGGLGNETSIQPQAQADLPASGGASVQRALSEIWPWLLALGCAAFIAEWAVATRRG